MVPRLWNAKVLRSIFYRSKANGASTDVLDSSEGIPCGKATLFSKPSTHLDESAQNVFLKISTRWFSPTCTTQDDQLSVHSLFKSSSSKDKANSLCNVPDFSTDELLWKFSSLYFKRSSFTACPESMNATKSTAITEAHDVKNAGTQETCLDHLGYPEFFTWLTNNNSGKLSSHYELTPATTCHTPPTTYDTKSPIHYDNLLGWNKTLSNTLSNPLSPESSLYQTYALSSFANVDMVCDSNPEYVLHNSRNQEILCRTSLNFIEEKRRCSAWTSNHMHYLSWKNEDGLQNSLFKVKSFSFSVADTTFERESQKRKPYVIKFKSLQEALHLYSIPNEIIWIRCNSASSNPCRSFLRAIKFSKRCKHNYSYTKAIKNKKEQPFEKKFGNPSDPVPCVPIEYTAMNTNFFSCCHCSSLKYCLTESEIRAIADLSYMSQIPYDESNTYHERLLFQYWWLASDTLSYITNCASMSLVSLHNFTWTSLGFQGNNPRTDFRGGGVLSLACMVYFAQHYTSIFATILKEASSLRCYPFSAGFINVAHLLYVCLHLNPRAKQCSTGEYSKLSQKAYKSFARLLSDPTQRAFEELFSCCCISLHHNWKKLSCHSTLLDFKKSLCHTKKRLVRVLESQPESSEGFKKLIEYNFS